MLTFEINFELFTSSGFYGGADFERQILSAHRSVPTTSRSRSAQVGFRPTPLCFPLRSRSAHMLCTRHVLAPFVPTSVAIVRLPTRETLASNLGRPVAKRERVRLYLRIWPKIILCRIWSNYCNKTKYICATIECHIGRDNKIWIRRISQQMSTC